MSRIDKVRDSGACIFSEGIAMTLEAIARTEKRSSPRTRGHEKEQGAPDTCLLALLGF